VWHFHGISFVVPVASREVREVVLSDPKDLEKGKGASFDPINSGPQLIRGIEERFTVNASLV